MCTYRCALEQTWYRITLDNIVIFVTGNGACHHETFFWFTSPDGIKQHFVPPTVFFFFFFSFCMREDELKHSVCSNWKNVHGALSRCGRCSLCMSLCGCVGVCLCMPVCRQWGTDAERCVLIFALHRAPLAVMLGCSDVTHVSLQNIQHRNDSVGWSKWHVHPLYISPLSLYSCVTLFLSLTLVVTVL